MPRVHCAHCGEELMGAVNRCWRCGRAFLAEYGPDNLPPIRRRPIPLELVNQSLETLQAAQTSSDSTTSLLGNVASASPSTVLGDVAPSLHIPQGGRDAHAGNHHVATSAPYFAAPPKPAYPTNVGAAGGAIASVVLGVMALVATRLITPGALLISILGVGMGVWGLYSDRRGLAILGLALCCIAMAISGFLIVVQLYTLVYGYDPFEPGLPMVE